MSFHRLLSLFERARDSGHPLVLCTVINTGGSTYAKPGAQMLIDGSGEYAGLLSGGCLEGDLREHAREVAATGVARIVSYDLRSSTDQLFGLGAGCEGAMDILLVRLGEHDGWQPMPYLAAAYRRGQHCRVAFVVASREAGIEPGLAFPADEISVDAVAADAVAADTAAADSARAGQAEKADERLSRLRAVALGAPDNGIVTAAPLEVELFVGSFAPPPTLLLLGGGPDARPVATLAAFLGWRIVIVDHRSVYLSPGHFPASARLIESRAGDLARHLRLDDHSAAIVMSHHLDSDLGYLRALAQSAVPYVGLLGPAARREKLLADLGADAGALRGRLRAPVGLDIGGRSPESIALSIIGEVHAALAGRAGRPFSETA
jgi:xanthine dehydrogenase accessory factor